MEENPICQIIENLAQTGMALKDSTVSRQDSQDPYRVLKQLIFS